MTTAKINPPPAKRTRRGGRRGKAGCMTCRARHVKCDEIRPSCVNCKATGRKCDGYEGRTAASHQQAVPPFDITRFSIRKPSPWNDSQVDLAPALGLPSNEESNRFFHSFLHGCVPSLTEVMDSEFWQRGILRASSTPAVQHAAIALGAVYEQQATRRSHHDGLSVGLHNKRLETLSSLRYTSAIQVLQHRIAAPSKTSAMLEEIMVACMIFIFLEILRGDDVAAVTHLDGSLKLQRAVQASSQALIDTREGKVQYETIPTLEGLTKLFFRLDIQSVLYMGSRTLWPPDESSVYSHKIDIIPTSFDVFLDARDSLYAHLAHIMSFVTPPEGAEKCFPAWTPHPDRGFDIYTIFHGSTYRDYTVPKASTKRRHFMQVLSRWKSAFQGFLHRETAKSTEALAGCALLWLTYYTARIKLAVAYTEDECCYDEQLPSFKKIVEQAEAYLRHTASSSQLPNDLKINSAMPSLKPKKKDFNLHVTVCYPLYYTALKCRYKPLRNRALEMLRNSEPEGIWDPQMLAKVAEYVITVEEQSNAIELHNVIAEASPFGVLEANRIHCLSLNVDKSSQIIWLKYNRRATDPQGEISRSSNPLKRWRIDSTILTWKDATAASAEPTRPK